MSAFFPISFLCDIFCFTLLPSLHLLFLKPGLITPVRISVSHTIRASCSFSWLLPTVVLNISYSLISESSGFSGCVTLVHPRIKLGQAAFKTILCIYWFSFLYICTFALCVYVAIHGRCMTMTVVAYGPFIAPVAWLKDHRWCLSKTRRLVTFFFPLLSLLQRTYTLILEAWDWDNTTRNGKSSSIMMFVFGGVNT